MTWIDLENSKWLLGSNVGRRHFLGSSWRMLLFLFNLYSVRLAVLFVCEVGGDMGTR